MNRTKEQWANWLPFEHSEFIAQQDIAELHARIEALEAEVARLKSISIQRIDECLSLARERDALLMDVAEATAANNCLQAEIIPLHKELSRQFAEIAAQTERAEIEAIVIRAAEETRSDLGESGTNYPAIRVLLGFVEKAIRASKPSAPDLNQGQRG